MDNNASQLINAQAAKWHARMLAAECSPSDRAAFERWLAADPMHASAYAKAQRLAALLSAMTDSQHIASDTTDTARSGTTAATSAASPAKVSQSAALRLQQMADAALAAYPAPQRVGRWMKAVAAASFVLLGALLVTQYASLQAVPEQTSYENTTLHQTQVQLADGSTVYLDVRSSVTVRLSEHARELTLQKGRAYFSVAHDAARPFSVVAAGTRTVALGTRFEVSLLEAQRVQVTLAQGSVAIMPATQRSDWREQLVPGQRLTVQINDDHQRDIAAVNADRAIAWSAGKLVFEGESLRSVLAQFNRYSTDKLVLGDASLADMPVGGSFSVGSNSREFVEALSAVMSLRSERVGEHEIVLFQNHSVAGVL